MLLTRLAEIDDRRLYLREGYPSMYAYCVGELHFFVDAAYKHINAARTARQFTAILMAVAEGGLCLRAVLMLAPHLTSGNADELIAAATHKPRAELELLLAQRFPRPDLPERLQAIPSPTPIVMTHPVPDAGAPSTGRSLPGQLATERVEATIPDQPVHGQRETPLAAPVCQLAPERVESSTPRPRMSPLAPERFGLQVTLDQETYDLLQQARALTSHQIPAGEIAPVLKSALKLYVAHLEKRKFAATTCPRRSRSVTASSADACASPRHIPAAVKRAVWERDGEQCTFVSDTGRRCPARTHLEFDHIEPVARGGEPTAENIRLRCRGHNQYAAECAFGAEFMSDKRAEARARRGITSARPASS